MVGDNFGCSQNNHNGMEDEIDSENFTYLRPSSNLNYYPHADQPPYFDRRASPRMADVILLRDFLRQMMPVELIDVIIDLAEYWPHTSSTLDMTTRVYSGHMSYGSYIHDIRKQSKKDRSTPESRRECLENGFLLRTPPLGIQCVQSNPSTYRRPSCALSNRKKSSENGETRTKHWLPPRDSHPARMIVFEILSREERLEDRPFLRVRGTHSSVISKTSFDATIDSIRLPQMAPQLDVAPMIWTTEAATQEAYAQLPTRISSGVWRRGSSKTHSTLKTHTIVTENFSAQNKKTLTIWRYDECVSSRSTSEKTFGSRTGSGFVRCLRNGESIALWARARDGDGNARTPCCNIVERAKIHVFWAV